MFKYNEKRQEIHTYHSFLFIGKINNKLEYIIYYLRSHIIHRIYKRQNKLQNSRSNIGVGSSSFKSRDNPSFEIRDNPTPPDLGLTTVPWFTC